MEEEREVTDLAASVDSADAYRAWELRYNKLLDSLRERCRERGQRINIGTMHSLVARIVRLEDLRNTLQQRFAGAGHSMRGFLWFKIETAFKSRVLTGAVVNSSYIEPRRFLVDARDTVIDQIYKTFKKHSCLKVNTVFNGEFVAISKIAVKNITTRNHQLFSTSHLRDWYNTHVLDTILTALDEFQERDSGWALSRILNLTVNINKCNPMRAGCWIDIPREIMIKRAVVNVRSNDNACFAWAVVAALYPVKKHNDKCSSYPDYSTILNFDGIKFPMTLKRITKFERLNDISINVFTTREKERSRIEIVPLRLTDCKKDTHVNLLYLPDLHRGDNIGHFAWIKNLSRLVGSQLSGNERAKYICDRCLHYFNTNERLSAHIVDCGKMNDCAIVLPTEEDKLLSFRNYNRKERLSFVVYANLECALKKENNGDNNTEKRHDCKHHKPFSVGYYLRSTNETIASVYRFHRGENCLSWFVDELSALAHRVRKILVSKVANAELTPKEKRAFQNARYCHICQKPFESDDQRVHDYCHLTGRYRGPAHSLCNLNYRNSYVIPVFFHNLTGYDAHYIIKDITNKIEGSVELLPLTKEKYIFFTKRVKDTSSNKWDNYVKLHFVDSYNFLSTSLEKLASYLDKSKLRIVRSECLELSDKDFHLLTRKGIFPYEYVDSVERLSETKLPPRETFHSLLTGETATEADYKHALNVWQRFRVRNLGEYSDLCLKTDVLLLADVFENFRDTCIQSYGLDPTYYYTLPGYTWDAMLRYTGITFELLTDIDMVLFVERGIRGGLNQCSNRYAKANNKYMPSYDSSESSTYLMYFDINNLYEWAMREPLPFKDFRWVEDPENFDVMSVASDSAIGYILEIDLAYPQELHDAHADLPFCPVRTTPPGKQSARLLATLFDKSRYVIHYRNLQQCVKHGLRVTKIHRVLQFAQSPWLRRYIELNTTFIIRANNEFEKNMFKLMNNAVFEKMMENVRDRVDVRLVTCWDGRYGAEEMIARPNFHSRSVFSENLMAVEWRKLKVRFDQPIYVGMCVLEISKTCLYEFHYEYMAPLYRDKCKIMYSDTDSLIYYLECEDAYEDMKRHISRFDTSEYPETNVYDMPRANKKRLGLMKDKNNGAIITEFVGLRAKMYALRVIGKGDAKRNVVERAITFDDYTRCLRDEIEQSRTQSCLRSISHEVYTVSESEFGLSPHDEKRYIISGSCDTLPWGHYKIP